MHSTQALWAYLIDIVSVNLPKEAIIRPFTLRRRGVNLPRMMTMTTRHATWRDSIEPPQGTCAGWWRQYPMEPEATTLGATRAVRRALPQAAAWAQRSKNGCALCGRYDKNYSPRDSTSEAMSKLWARVIRYRSATRPWPPEFRRSERLRRRSCRNVTRRPRVRNGRADRRGAAKATAKARPN